MLRFDHKEFFLQFQNASGYVRDLCCHLQRDGASLSQLKAPHCDTGVTVKLAVMKES